MILSILIATLESRRAKFEALYAKLRQQVRAYGLHGRVEILSSRDAGEKTIGLKRNELLATATGDYVCFIDDDDECSMDYVVRLASACTANQDCVGFFGQIMWHGRWTPFIHSLRYKEYRREKNGTFVRPVNHLNPIRRSIAVKYPFSDCSFAEDTFYAMSIVKAGALKTEVFLPKPAVYYYTPAKG